MPFIHSAQLIHSPCRSTNGRGRDVSATKANGCVTDEPVMGSARRRNGWKESEMFETPITVVGNIVTKPDRKRVGDQELIKFRVASNSRRRTADGNWEPGNSFFLTVNCWGRLVTGVGAALGKGDPVVVVGYVYTSEYEDKEGVRRSSVEMRATSVGPDLARCVARIESRRQAGTNSDEQPSADSVDHAEGRTADPDEADDDSAIGAIDGKRLPLSA
jgi:single-strand DNA-binding protein